MNTKIALLYRDACNYKAYGSEVFAGDPTPMLVARLRAALEDGKRLVPEQVSLTHLGSTDGLMEARWPDEEDDHGYEDVEEITATEAEPTDSRTFEEFVRDCEKVKTWDPMVAIEEAGGWTDPEVAAKLRGCEDEDEDETLPEGVTLIEPDVNNLPERDVPEGHVRVVLQIVNTYELYARVTTYADVVIPAPPFEDATYPDGRDPNGQYETPHEAWKFQHIIPLTGVGHEDGDSWYDVTVLWSSDAMLIGATYDWGY